MVLNYKYGIHQSRSSSFQNFSNSLGARLLEVLESNDITNLLICLPGCMLGIGTGYLRRSASAFWERYTVENLTKLLPLINHNRLYGETNISRFYLSHKNKTRCLDFLKHLQQIWNKRDIIIIEGRKTMLGIGNDLFSNANSVRRVLCPPKDAWSKYDEILSTIKETIPIEKNSSNNPPLIICALGMTATILAYDLANLGYQAIDLGHIDIEYEWLRMHATSKVPVPGKFTNEAHAHIDSSRLEEQLSKQDIIAIIS